MGPKRKKSKSNGDEESEQAERNTDVAQETPKEGDETSATQAAAQSDTSTLPSPAPSRSSWSWRSKATPITQIARESIFVAQGSTSESSEAKRPPNSVSKSVRGSRKSIPLAAEATKVHATSDVSRPSFSSEEKVKASDEKKSDETKEMVVEQAQLPPEPVGASRQSGESTGRQSWFGWWSRPDGYASDGDVRQSKKQKLDKAGEVARNTPLPGTPIHEPTDAGLKNAKDFEGVGSNQNTTGGSPIQPEMTTTHKASRSWFGLWSSAQNDQAAAEQNKKDDEPAQGQPEINVSTEPSNVEDAVKDPEASKVDNKKEVDERPKPSGWAFWSSDKPKDPAPTPGGTQKQIGELAVADTPSQTNPEAAQFNEQREDQKPTTKAAAKRSGSLLRPKRGRPEKTKDSSAESSSAPPTPAGPSPPVSEIPTPSQTPPPREESEPPKKGKAVQAPPNHVLPSFRDSFLEAPNPGYIERLTHYLAQSLHIPGSQPSPSPQHVCISSSPPKIKKAVALGIHGFFPGALIQRVLGQPTGTSIRFANYAATSIKSWYAEHQPEIQNVEVEKVALEGEGYIADRVATLWKLLLNWLSHLRSADFIFVACHSQGVPVAIMLVAKLIQLGALSSNVRIGVCAMAGINLGPFLEYKSRLFGGTALELFEFCDYESQVSKAYAESLDVCLRYGVRVTFVGSIDDQLVSLESSLHTPLSHPYVSRAVFIDGRLHAPNFLTHLVVFALKLRNLGVSDHGLIRELSAPLAGSLVGGEGHSRIYDDPAVYRLAVEFALESTDASPATLPTPQSDKDKPKEASPALANAISTKSLLGIPPKITPYEPPPNSASNPFNLPFSVRGMLDEDLVKKDQRLNEELQALIKEFEEWKPTSKVLRDVRWRLEGVRSMH